MLLPLLGSKSKGITVLETLVAIAIIVIVLVGVYGLVVFSLGVTNALRKSSQAHFLAQEAAEAVRNFKDNTEWSVNGLGALSEMVFYYPIKTGASLKEWQMILGQEEIEGFTRSIVIHEVGRDISGNILQSGGTVDPDIKKITVSVSWQDRGQNKEIQLNSYFANWKQ